MLDLPFASLLRVAVLAAVIFPALPAAAAAQQEPPLTRADTLRGTITPERAWWDVAYYDLAVHVNPASSSIAGSNVIEYRVVTEGPDRDMQLDLAATMTVDSILANGSPAEWRRDGNVLYLRAPGGAAGSVHRVAVHYGGKPLVAANAPWDGGFVWARDPRGAPWVGTAVQGTGASVWWPTKDHQSDEPDSMRIRVTVPDPMIAVTNGRPGPVVANPGGTSTYTWTVSNPISTYSISISAGDYVRFGETFDGEAGPLSLDYWVLEPHLADARRHFAQVPEVLTCFETWFGPYPFYEDSFKLVESPYLGMEHQSAIAYGNRFVNGYLGQDLSGTGLGLSWDYIIVHEAAHEWWGNNVTTDDIADMWVHEGFGNYAEGIFVECRQGEEAGARYIRGLRAGIANDGPVIGPYGVNREGSGDMYPKGANLLHTIRQVVDDTDLWRSILRGLNETFRHETVTSAEVEAYVSDRAGRDFGPVFDQYLRRASLPILELAVRDGTLSYRWRAEVEGFDLPVRVTLAPDRFAWIYPETGEWKTEPVELPSSVQVQVDEDLYILVDRVP
ncbi:MAG: M1 family metallopeptidase [Gemmatimonadota bacterium]